MMLAPLTLATQLDYQQQQQQQPTSSPGSGDSSLITNNEAFLQCIIEQNCGLVNKCSYKLYPTPSTPSTPLPHLPHNNGTMLPPTSLSAVSGHLMTLKNHMPFGIVFYWDVLGYETPQGEEPNKRYHGIYSPPNSIKYIDTKYYVAHTVRLYVSTAFQIGGPIPPYVNGEFPPPNPQTLENVQTIIPSGDECPRHQTCRMLDAICYMASSTNPDCLKYRTVCSEFNDADRVARDSCVPECAYTYYSDIIFGEIDPELVEKWFSMGGGVVGSGYDGTCNTGPIIGLLVALILSLLMNFIFMCLGSRYRHSLKNIDMNNQDADSKMKIYDDDDAVHSEQTRYYNDDLNPSFV